MNADQVDERLSLPDDEHWVSLRRFASVVSAIGARHILAVRRQSMNGDDGFIILMMSFKFKVGQKVRFRSFLFGDPSTPQGTYTIQDRKFSAENGNCYSLNEKSDEQIIRLSLACTPPWMTKPMAFQYYQESVFEEIPKGDN